jgi:hypothetical protein
MQLSINNDQWLKLRSIFVDFNDQEIIDALFNVMSDDTWDETTLIGLTTDGILDVESESTAHPEFLTFNDSVNIASIHFINTWESKNGKIPVVTNLEF